jgi:hypothetical protein
MTSTSTTETVAATIPDRKEGFDLLALIMGLVAVAVIAFMMLGELFIWIFFDLSFIPNIVGVLFGSFWNVILLGSPILIAFFFSILGSPKTFVFNVLLRGIHDVYGFKFSTLWELFTTGLEVLFRVIPRHECGAYAPLNHANDSNVGPVDENWIYINGVATTKEIADANRHLLFEMFGRPIHLMYNPTNSILVDLIECISWKVGIFGSFTSAPRRELIKLLKAKLDEKKKVVLIAHSQGTIITGNALYALSHDKAYNGLMKEYLEVYNFANCAHRMDENEVKYLENISNGRDFVAYIGHLFPFPKLWLDDHLQRLNITGKSVIEPKNWGHLLNSHYLYPMQRHHQYGESKLWQYHAENEVTSHNGGQTVQEVTPLIQNKSKVN